MQSNNPYRRVDDGIGSGLVGGAVIGAGVAGGFQMGGRALSGALSGRGPIRLPQNAGNYSMRSMAAGQARRYAGKAGATLQGLHTSAFGGSGKRKAAAYGLAAAGGAVLGGLIDGAK